MKLMELSLEARTTEWRVITGFEDYEVNRKGEVRNKYSLRKLKYKLDKDGYQQVVLFKSGKRYYVKVHRIVAMVFLPAKPGYEEVNNKNKNRQDNRVVNLEYMNREENMRHRNGLRRRRGTLT